MSSVLQLKKKTLKDRIRGIKKAALQRVEIGLGKRYTDRGTKRET